MRVPRETDSEIFLRLGQGLLPIEHQLPRALGVCLPDLEEMPGAAFAARVGIFAVPTREIAAAAHVAGNDFERHPSLFGPEQLCARISSDGGKRAIAIKPDIIAAKVSKRFCEIEFRESKESALRFAESMLARCGIRHCGGFLRRH